MGETIDVVVLDGAGRDAFLEYAHAHGAAHDDSYLAPEDLAGFDPAVEPAVLAAGADGQTLGAASAMLDGYRQTGAARLRILHATDAHAYEPMLDRLETLVPADVSRLFLFLPEHAGEVEDVLSARGFVTTRRAYILKHGDPSRAQGCERPSGTEVRPALPSAADDWAHVVNSAFRGEPGRYDMTPERATEILARTRVIRGGTLIAWRNGTPAGVVLTVGDADDPLLAEIEGLAVVPGHQGVGLGRTLLCAACRAAADDGRLAVHLSVSTNNRRAIALYLDAGFSVDDVRVCWERVRESG
jgi:ribosomal protein S18 acetylase RimI-like enzyme